MDVGKMVLLKKIYIYIYKINTLKILKIKNIEKKIPYITNLATNTTPDAKVTTGYQVLLT